MSRSQLDAYGGNDPIWGFVDRLGADRFSGQADVGVSPRVHLYATEGRIYFAERDGDDPIESRFVTMGVLTAEQLERGGVRFGDDVSLARLFTRDPSVDRDEVELVVEMMTSKTLAAVAIEPTRPGNGMIAPTSTSAPQTAVVGPVDPATLPTLGTWTPLTAEERQRSAGHTFAPMDFTSLDLPKLAARPMSVGEITAAQAMVAATAPTNVRQAGTTPAVLPPLSTRPDSVTTTSTFAQLLKTPPSNPTVEQSTNIETLLSSKHTSNGTSNGTGNGTTPWKPPASPLDTVGEIWEMVDQMLGLDVEDASLAMAGVAGDNRSRGWRRGKKG